MTEDQKRASGLLFCPTDPELKAIKLRTHNLCTRYNRTFEDESELRASLIADIFAEVGEGCFIQGPLTVHYGCHTHIGERFFGNFNLTIQDDADVIIGNDCNFGPNTTIVTPIHPMLPSERKLMLNEKGEEKRLCYAKPVKIGNDCWFGANVLVLPGVTIGNGCVIGAGSVVVKDIPDGCFAAGNPARVIRKLSDADSMANKPDVLGGCKPL